LAERRQERPDPRPDDPRPDARPDAVSNELLFLLLLPALEDELRKLVKGSFNPIRADAQQTKLIAINS